MIKTDGPSSFFLLEEGLFWWLWCPPVWQLGWGAFSQMCLLIFCNSSVFANLYFQFGLNLLLNFFSLSSTVAAFLELSKCSCSGGWVHNLEAVFLCFFSSGPGQVFKLRTSAVATTPFLPEERDIFSSINSRAWPRARISARQGLV